MTEDDALKKQLKELGERLERLENIQGLGQRIAWWQNPSFLGLAFGGVIGGKSLRASVESAITRRSRPSHSPNPEPGETPPDATETWIVFTP